METSVSFIEAAKNDPHLPPVQKIGDIHVPVAPANKDAVQLEYQSLLDLSIKTAASVPRFTTDWFAEEMRFSFPLARHFLEKMCQESLVEELWQTTQGKAHFRIGEQGAVLAPKLVEACGYLGPAPVPIETYSAFCRYQFAISPPIRPEHVINSLSGLVISKKAIHLAGLAAASGRSLFVHGPPGNGKSSLGRKIQGALQGDYWVPYAISVGNSVIRVFDEQAHQRIEVPKEIADAMDRRWVRIKRPMVVVGGELTLELLDLIYSPSFRFYEAPPHLKANGGVFLVDDFGRERISPEQLLNRFITPMEHWIDYFTLRNGQKIQLPLRHVLIIATNLSPEHVTDPAFLRRMGYRLYLGSPSEEQYTKIFHEYAGRLGATVPPGVIERLLDRYREQGRELRACEPRDLIERSNDICKFQNKPLELTNKVLDFAWTGYFGDHLPINRAEPPPKEEVETRE